jgi:ferredoxin
MSNIIYCFTGTGNSLWLAKNAARELGDAKVVSIMELRGNPAVPAKYERVGFVFPTCFLHPPKVVKEIGVKLQFAMHQKAFIIATCGGGNGFTLSDFRKLIQPKLKNRVQEFTIPLPGNHLVGFGAWSDSRQQKMFNNAKKSLSNAVRQIQSRFRHDTSTKAKRDLPLGLMTWMSKTFNGWLGVKDIFSTVTEYYTTDACIHCGKCAKVCPVGNIKSAEGKVTFGDNCQQCMACIQWCPQRAIAHPNVPADRKRYHHPDFTIEDMIELNQSGRQK